MINNHEIILPSEKLEVLILCGGFGTRINKITKKIPKPLIKVNNKEFLNYIIENLLRYNIRNIHLLCYYKSKLFEKYIKKINKKFALHIKIICEKKKLDTGGAVVNALNKLKNKNDFLLLNGDTYINANYINLFKEFKKSKKNNLLVVTKSNLVSKKLNTLSIKENKILLNKNGNLINTGNLFFNKKFFKNYIKNSIQKFSLENVLLKKKIEKKEIYGKMIKSKIIDIGSYKFLNQSKRFLENNYKIKAIFLDRDGTLNIDSGYTYQVKNLKLIKKSVNLIKEKYYDYFKVIVTNQSGIGRGYFSEKKFQVFCKKLLELLNKKNIYISKIMFCPHHINGLGKYKKLCSYRKPNTQSINYLVKKYNLRLKKSVFLGDSTKDKKLAYKKNIKFINVNKLSSL